MGCCKSKLMGKVGIEKDSKEDAEKHGYTRGCGGCSWFRGLGREPHNDACRERFRILIRVDAKVTNYIPRKRVVEEKELKRKAERAEQRRLESERLAQDYE